MNTKQSREEPYHPVPRTRPKLASGGRWEDTLRKAPNKEDALATAKQERAQGAMRHAAGDAREKPVGYMAGKAFQRAAPISLRSLTMRVQ